MALLWLLVAFIALHSASAQAQLQAPITVSVHTSKPRWATNRQFVCYNLDASRDRQFFDRNLDPNQAFGRRIAASAAHLAEGQGGFSLLRFGGTGNDFLTYQFGNIRCPPRSATEECLNQTWWDNLAHFTQAARARIVFGLNIMKRANGRWNSTEARELMKYSITKNYSFFGFELGNEKNTDFTGDAVAEDFGTLHSLLVELWPNEASRPLLFGPDPHSFTQGGPEPVKLAWLGAFMDGCLKRKLPLYALTHHEYIEVDLSSFTSPQKLDVTAAIAIAVNDTKYKHNPDVRIFAGEIGPHNGATDVCSHSLMRWANFGDSLWYADSLATKAYHGYAGYCRQNLIGIDYGILDCVSGEPLPDYWTVLLWTRLMGPTVLDLTVSPSNGTVRTYAHCSTQGGVVILLINLNENAIADVSVDIKSTQLRYTLSGSSVPRFTNATGLAGTNIVLNGKLLELLGDSLPRLDPVEAPEGSVVPIPPVSIVFLHLPFAQVPACG